MPTTEARPVRAVAGLSSRLARRGTLAMAASAAIYMGLEALAFNTSYPDAASRAAVTLWGTDPALKVIAGQATAVETLGGFIVWDAGLYIALVITAWSLATASRLLRGDEDQGRIEPLLTGPVTPARLLLTQVLVLLAACALVGVALGGSLAAFGAEPAGAALYATGMITYLWVIVAAVALVAQLLQTRAATLAVAGGALVAAILMRMVSNSDEARGWLGWLTPAAWPDHVLAFGANRWWPLCIPVASTVGMLMLAMGLRTRRDSGAGVMRWREHHRSRMWALGSARAFAWRCSVPVLAAWMIGIAVAGGVIGMLLPAVEENLAKDESFRQILTTMGINLDDLIGGVVNLWSTILGLAIAVYVAFRMGATRNEEATTRAEQLLTRPLTRSVWLGGHVLSMLAAILVLCGVAAIAMWAAAAVAQADLNASDPFIAMANMLSMLVVFAGLATTAFATVPRHTVPVTATAAVVAFVLEMVGPALHWPAWVLGISPFHHLAGVPVDPLNWPAAFVMTGIGIVLMGAGVVAFTRRDLIGA